VGPRENELEVILHESTRESRTNQRVMHTVWNSIEQIVDRSLSDDAINRVITRRAEVRIAVAPRRS